MNWSMKLNFSIILFYLAIVNGCSSPEPSISIERLEQDIIILSHDSLEGRAPLTKGEEKTLAYLKARMQEIGLEPPFNGSYLQEVPLVEITSTIPNNVRFNKGGKYMDLAMSNDYTFWSPLLKPVEVLQNSELVFAGFGIDAPEWGWNDFDGIDLEGKTIVVLVNDPGFHTADSTLFNGRSMTYFGRWSYKFLEANRKGAAGCIIVHEDEAAGYPWSVVNRRTNRPEFYLNNKALRENVCGVNGWVTLEAARELFAFCGMDYEQMRALASQPDFKPVPMNANYSISIINSWKESSSFNVAGLINGSERPDEVLVYTAHWDHLGIGEPVDGDSIYNGASDNAAAVAWMFSIAQTFKDMKTPPERSILFLSPTAEEAGMLGSQHYVDNPVFPSNKTVACFNSDVILFLGSFEDVTVTGLGHSELDRFLKEEAARQGRYVCADPNPENGMFYRSDQFPFLKAGVPSLFAKGYTHQVDMGREETIKAVDEYWRTTYHKPSDHYIQGVHKLDGLVDDAQLFFRLGVRLANSSYFPKWSESSEFYVER